MHEFIADSAAGPATTKDGFVAIQSLLTDFAMSRLDREQQRFPLTARFANAHGLKYSGAIRTKTRRRTLPG